MSISYHGIVGFGSGKATLPSVETWANNMNILRDPPKAITTRKIDKVGQTSEITEMIDNSGDRACEAILTYARGVNPMVAVSYDNYGNNGGQKSGNVNQTGLNVNGGSAKQAYLPYRIMNAGAFRPPIRDQRDLLPLSRLPRIWTSSFSQPGFADFSKKAMCPVETGDDYKGIKDKDQMLKACIRPTATYQIQTPIIENFEVKYVIKNPIQVKGTSGIYSNAKFNGEIGNPVKMANRVKKDININVTGDVKKYSDISHFNTTKYLQEQPNINVVSKMTKTINSNLGEDHGIRTDNYIQDNMNIDVESKNWKTINSNLGEDHGIRTDNYLQDNMNIDVESKNWKTINSNLGEDHGIRTDNYLQDNMNIDVESKNWKTINSNLGEDHGIRTDNYLQDNMNIDVESKNWKTINSNLGEDHGIRTDNYLQDNMNIDVESKNWKTINSNLGEDHGIRTDNYLQDNMNIDISSNVSQNITPLSLEEIYGVQTNNNRLKDNFNINYITPQKSYDKTEYIHKDITLDRVMPYYQSRTNNYSNIQKIQAPNHIGRHFTQNRPTPSVKSNIGSSWKNENISFNSRKMALKPTISAGGFDPNPTIPMAYHENTIQEFDNQKTQMRKNVYNMQHERNTNNFS